MIKMMIMILILIHYNYYYANRYDYYHDCII
jgi:hypothetical protein